MRLRGSVHIWAATEEYMAQWQCTHWQYTKRSGQITDMRSFHFTCSQFNRGYKLYACSWDDLAISRKSSWSDLLGWQDCRTSDMECYRHSDGVLCRYYTKISNCLSEVLLHKFLLSGQHYGFMSKMCIKSASACLIHVQIRFLYTVDICEEHSQIIIIMNPTFMIAIDDLCLNYRMATAKKATELWPVTDHCC